MPAITIEQELYQRESTLRQPHKLIISHCFYVFFNGALIQINTGVTSLTFFWQDSYPKNPYCEQSLITLRRLSECDKTGHSGTAFKRRVKSSRTRAITVSQFLASVWRNKRAVGYQGIVSPSSP